MFCKKCGNELNEGAEFCPKCGTPVNSAMREEPGKEDVSKYDFTEKGKSKITLLIILVCVVLVVLGVLAYWIYSTKINITKAKIGEYTVTVPAEYLSAGNREDAFYYKGSIAEGSIIISIEPNIFSTAEDFVEFTYKHPNSAFGLLPSEGTVIQDSTLKIGDFDGLWATNNNGFGAYAGAVLMNDTDYCTITVHVGDDKNVSDATKVLKSIKIVRN